MCCGWGVLSFVCGENHERRRHRFFEVKQDQLLFVYISEVEKVYVLFRVGICCTHMMDVVRYWHVKGDWG